jgi:sRNA-binding carbon storage regulator CsrA
MSDRTMKLKRRRGQGVVLQIGETVVKVEVCRHSDGSAEIGITAGDDVKIYRDELWTRIVAEREAERTGPQNPAAPAEATATGAS